MLPTLLGGLTAKQFLRDYWQKKPLLIRGAVPGFGALLDRESTLQLACDEDIESRLIANDGGTWDTRRGPFSAKDFKRRKDIWTILVQGVNLTLPEGDTLLRQFDFIPHARLDDLMVSYAVDGGGVGPHFDNYDVFLLQGSGKRRWRISGQKDMALRDDLPLKILRNFKSEQEWVLEAGDMLYLPPQYAHDGVAIGECMTWSIGFRAPPAQELAEQFLGYLQERISIPGRYADPDLKLQKHPGEISKDMIEQVSTILNKINWRQDVVRDFLGCTLTEPKSHVYFDPPEQPLSLARFLVAAKKKGVRLDARTQLLFSGPRFFINGEECDVHTSARSALHKLADWRQLLPTELPAELGLDLLYDWYCDGFLHLN